jgi:hypothetical protein
LNDLRRLSAGGLVVSSATLDIFAHNLLLLTSFTGLFIFASIKQIMILIYLLHSLESIGAVQPQIDLEKEGVCRTLILRLRRLYKLEQL